MNLRPLLNFIAHHVSHGDYNAAGRQRNDRPIKPLTEMTIGEVLAWQGRGDPNCPSSKEAGRYKLSEDTLLGLYDEAGLSLLDLFEPRHQDALAVQLLIRKGIVHYLNGAIPIEKIANGLAKEWESLPWASGPQKRRSRAKSNPFLDAIRSAREPSESRSH